MAKIKIENIYKSFANRNNSNREPAIAGKNGNLKRPLDDRISSNSVLRAVNFTVEDGEFMVLVGPSGCGKSTLLRIIAGLEELTGGNIWVGDRLVNNLAPKQRDIAMVFQNYALYPHLNVYDNIAFGLRRMPDTEGIEKQSLQQELLVTVTRSLPKKMRYLSNKEKSIQTQVREVARLLQIEQLLDRYPKQLSGGQKQRVALGRAIARKPQLFLMDEPLSNLDAKLRAETRSQIVKLQKQLGITTIYVTHDRVEAMTMGDRIAVMNQGQIQQIAPPLEIYERPVNLFVAEFIGSPPMNFIKVKVENGLDLINQQFSLTLPNVWQKTLINFDRRTILLGIRPEHFEINSQEESLLVVTVDRVEALGNETYIAFYLDREQIKPFQARISPDRRVQPGEEICLSIAKDKIHLFEMETGRSMRPE